MRIGIAGYGNIGQYIASVFRDDHEIVPYDPPRGLGTLAELDGCDFVFICVPTPSRADGSCDTSIVEEVVASVTPRQVLICHSTVAIGTTERLRETYGKRLVFVPEYAGESADHPYRNIENQTFFFLGGAAEDTTPVQHLLETVFGRRCDFYHVDPRTAEVVKYMENAFLALKVTFCNEFFDLCQAFGVDYDTARELWTRDFRVGKSHTEVTPARGYGGMCLPKDVAAVVATAREAGTPLELLETMQRVNARIRRKPDAVLPLPATEITG